jgi:hypothetical protein
MAIHLGTGCRVARRDPPAASTLPYSEQVAKVLGKLEPLWKPFSPAGLNLVGTVGRRSAVAAESERRGAA